MCKKFLNVRWLQQIALALLAVFVVFPITCVAYCLLLSRTLTLLSSLNVSSHNSHLHCLNHSVFLSIYHKIAMVVFLPVVLNLRLIVIHWLAELILSVLSMLLAICICLYIRLHQMNGSNFLCSFFRHSLTIVALCYRYQTKLYKIPKYMYKENLRTILFIHCTLNNNKRM